ncbi:MAG: hypothetical protein ACTSPS_02615 [Promethearchaeota archaeon]
MSFTKEKIKKKLERAAAKNMVRGVFFAAIYLVTTLIIPYLTFSWIRSLEVEGVEIDIYQKRYKAIIYWLVAFGLVISGTAFFAYSSPANSIRRGIFSLIQILLNCFYLWSYKFSGALEVEFELIDLGYMTMNLSQLILLYMGIYFLSVILKAYDLADFVINRKKIQAARVKGVK